MEVPNRYRLCREASTNAVRYKASISMELNHVREFCVIAVSKKHRVEECVGVIKGITQFPLSCRTGHIGCK
jgi:hypothetical protein